MSTRRLTTAQALVSFLARQYTERDGRRQRLISATWGIFGHGNVAGIGQALLETGAAVPGAVSARPAMPYLQGRNEQSMVHAAVGYARQSGRLSAHAVTTSIGPGATNLVTGAALATINHLPVLLLPGDIFATRPADPVLQQLEVPSAGDLSVNDCLRPVSRYFDRITRPEALVPAALQAMRTLADPGRPAPSHSRCRRTCRRRRTTGRRSSSPSASGTYAAPHPTPTNWNGRYGPCAPPAGR